MELVRPVPSSLLQWQWERCSLLTLAQNSHQQRVSTLSSRSPLQPLLYVWELFLS
jgi:hypothetical protein